MVDLSYSLVLILATVVKFVHGLPIFQETSYEPFPNYLKAFDFDQLNSPLDQQLSIPILNAIEKKNIAIGRADGFRPGK